MSDFTPTTEQRTILPSFRKTIHLASGDKISDDADLLAFAQKAVPDGKKVRVRISINVLSIEDN